MKMTKLSKIKSHLKPVVDFEFNSESVKSNKRFYSKKYQSDNNINNQQVCINFLKPRSNKMSLSVKNVVAIIFMCLIIQVFHL